MNRIIRYTYPRTLTQLPSLVGRSPWAGLESEIERLFGELAAPALAPRFPVDLYEDKDNTYVRAELPGVSRDAINVEMVDGYLNINASRKQADETFSFNRSVAIPEAVQADKVAAAYENGVLTVTLPKQEQAKPRKINIAVN
ncbi:MAG TPA: Hsp20/alpha crystallin family protein [Lacunisphaera sp.]|nr:Hsp20/alpha crystallin family protein [Lacunisphaera sp.]